MLMPLAALNAEQMPDWFILKTSRGMDIAFFCYLKKLWFVIKAAYSRFTIKFYSFDCS